MKLPYLTLPHSTIPYLT